MDDAYQAWCDQMTNEIEERVHAAFGERVTFALFICTDEPTVGCLSGGAVTPEMGMALAQTLRIFADKLALNVEVEGKA